MLGGRKVKKRKDREVYESISRNKNKRIKVTDKTILLNDNEDNRRLFEHCKLKAKAVVNPIIDWKDNDIWDYYRNECKFHNPLYQMGYYRVGCIGCPMAGKKRYKEFADFPKYKQAYIRAFEKMLELRTQRGMNCVWKSGEEVFHWWMEDEIIPGQMSIEEYMEGIN